MAERDTTVRLFLALWPPAAVRQALEELQRGSQWPDRTALVAPQRLHLTLHFLGAVPASRVPQLQQALHVPAAAHVIALQAGRCRLWPGGVAVLELEPPPALLRLHAALAQALAAAGWPVEQRRFRPHVTLARRARGARAAPDIPDVQWPVDGSYALVRSVIGRGYETLHTYVPARAGNQS